jgi:hypothetical protein
MSQSGAYTTDFLMRRLTAAHATGLSQIQRYLCGRSRSSRRVTSRRADDGWVFADIAPLLRDLGAELTIVRRARAGSTGPPCFEIWAQSDPPRSPLALLAADAVVVAVEPVRVVSLYIDGTVDVPGTVA